MCLVVGAAKKSLKYALLMSGPERIQIDFIQVELKLARTFCELAAQSNQAHFSSNLANARKAYSSAVRYISKLRASKRDLASLKVAASQVQACLRELEEQARARAS